MRMRMPYHPVGWGWMARSKSFGAIEPTDLGVARVGGVVEGVKKVEGSIRRFGA